MYRQCFDRHRQMTLLNGLSMTRIFRRFFNSFVSCTFFFIIVSMTRIVLRFLRVVFVCSRERVLWFYLHGEHRIVTRIVDDRFVSCMEQIVTRRR